MHIGLDQDANTANTIERNDFVLVVTPVAHLSHVFAVGLVFFVAWNFFVSG